MRTLADLKKQVLLTFLNQLKEIIENEAMFTDGWSPPEDWTDEEVAVFTQWLSEANTTEYAELPFYEPDVVEAFLNHLGSA